MGRGWFAAPTVRAYSPEDVVGLCAECAQPMVALEGDAHPTCDPDYPPMLKGLQRALARRVPGPT